MDRVTAQELSPATHIVQEDVRNEVRESAGGSVKSFSGHPFVALENVRNMATTGNGDILEASPLSHMEAAAALVRPMDNQEEHDSHPVAVPSLSLRAFDLSWQHFHHGIRKAELCFFALRPWSFTASITPALLGAVLAYADTGSFRPVLWLFELFTILTVHAAGNIVNTYYDDKNGFDRANADDRTIVDGILQPAEVINLATILYGMSMLGFFTVAKFSSAPLYLLVFIFFGGTAASFIYTGGSGLKYVACGELVIFLAFGPVTTLFCFVASSGYFSLVSVLYAVPLALTIVAVLHVNNIRDADSDAKEGAITMAILLGEKRSYFLYVLLLYVPFLIMGFFAVTRCSYFLVTFLTLPLVKSLDNRVKAALAVPLEKRYQSLVETPQITAKFSALFGVLYVICFVVEKHVF